MLFVNSSISGDPRAGTIDAFDRNTGRNHALMGLTMHLGEDFPSEEVIKASVLGKGVLLTVLPPLYGNMYDESLLLNLAQEAGRFGVPMFINFYPYSRARGFNIPAYRGFYRAASRIFREEAPNTAMVWSAEIWDAPVALAFYPGDGYVDWVGLEITKAINSQGNYDEFWPLFADFAAEFQYTKPIMITSLSISHFSTIDNSFRIPMAAAALLDFYDNIAGRWPRVKAVVYNSRSELGQGNGGRGRHQNNFLISGEEELMEAYRRAISGPEFLSAISSYPWERPQLTTFVSAIAIYDHSPYIKSEAAQNIFMNLPTGARRRLFGQRAYDLGFLAERVGAYVKVDRFRGVVYLTASD